MHKCDDPYCTMQSLTQHELRLENTRMERKVEVGNAGKWQPRPRGGGGEGWGVQAGLSSDTKLRC